MKEDIMQLIVGGRFQPFHNGHLEMLNFLHKNYNGQIVIGIANPDPEIAYPGDGEWIRFTKKDNPLNYWERYTNIKLVLKNHHELDAITSIVPMPRPSNNLLRANNYLPSKNRTFVVFTRRGDVIAKWKYEQYKKNGEKVLLHTLNELPDYAQIAEGRIIRDLIGLGSDYWKNMVSVETYNYLISLDIRKRILTESFDDEIAEKNVHNFGIEFKIDLKIPEFNSSNFEGVKLMQIYDELYNLMLKPYQEKANNELLFMIEEKYISYITEICENLFKNKEVISIPSIKRISGNLYQAEITIETRNKILDVLKK